MHTLVLELMGSYLQRVFPQSTPFLKVALIGLLFVVGFATFYVADIANNIWAHGLQVLAGMSLLKTLILFVAGVAALYLLVRYSEVTLALFFLVGLIKGDERLASFPVDLTVAVAGAVLIGVCVRMVLGRQRLALPREYVFYLPLLAMMILSLTYTPDLAGGLDKTLRFCCLTSIGIVAPFVLFDSTAKVKNFFLTMAIGGMLLAVNSLTMLGGSDRMVSPSGLNTELGAACAIALIIVWNLWFPRWSLLKRVLFYPILGLLVVGLIGSGGRFANVSAVLCLIIGTFLCRKLFTDVALIGGMGLLLLPLIWIPEASYIYLSSLANPPQAMGTRNGLMSLGVSMFSEHPFLGVGIQGFRFLSPNPITYNYPHNLILELGSELGLIAAVAFLVLVALAFRESWRQLRERNRSGDSPVVTVFLLLIFVFLDGMVSGDINDLRFMWFVIGLPYVLRNLQASHSMVVLDREEPVMPYPAYNFAARTSGSGTSDFHRYLQ